MVPVSGSAYTYSYATLGELVAWIIGWDLMLEYAIGNVAVAISWANYMNTLLDGFGIHLPLWLTIDYRTAALKMPEIAGGEVAAGAVPVDLTTSVGREAAVPDPEVFVAVTTTVIRRPTSVPASVYRVPVAPAIATQEPPLESHRCHWYAYDVGLLAQPPLAANRAEPSRAEPEIDGSDVFCGEAVRCPAAGPATASVSPAAAPTRTRIFRGIACMVGSPNS